MACGDVLERLLGLGFLGGGVGQQGSFMGKKCPDDQVDVYGAM